MKFVSPQFPEQKVTLKSARHTVDSMGNRDFIAGISIKFHDGQYDTEDPEIIEAIKKLNTYGTEIFSTEGESIASPEAIRRMNTEIEAVPRPTACPKCTFKAKTYLGLLSHVRSRHGGESDDPFSVDDLLPNQ